MCGIIGYVGKREALPVVLEGLSRMEYRGYDSAGVAVLGSDKLVCIKAKGKVNELKEKIARIFPTLSASGLRSVGVRSASIGIGHTRWATHGEPSERNSHPHTDCSGDIFVAHNGIIENFQKLKDQLLKKEHRFVSDTDTEIIAHLIEEYSKKERNLSKAIHLALKQLRGAFGIVVLSRNHPGTLVAARFGSPLILGIGKDENIIASDATAILSITNSVIYLNDGDMVTLTDGSYEISDFKNGNGKQERETTLIEWSNNTAERSGYPHFMLKEIMEQPQALRDTMRGRLVPGEGTVKFGGLEQFEDRIRDLKHIILAGMGTARFTCLVGEYALEELAHISAKVEFGSEFAYRTSALAETDALIAVSQSGETADTLNAVREAKRRGALTFGIVNVIGSSIAREVDAGIYNHVGPEIAVASTKASTSQVLLHLMLALYLGRLRGLSKTEGQAIIRAIQKLPAHIEKILESAPKIKALAKKYKKHEHFFCLGRKYNVASAFEGALKLKECSYIHVEGINTAELKHGPISLIDKNFPSIVIAPKDSVYEKNKSSIQEIKARKGPVIAITTEGNKELEKIADTVLYIPKTLEMLSPILAFVPMQLFAYYLAVERGNDVDKPRNLAKSVTVE
ncbi:MAG: glutamine--fructose-6-phosphate transaminase (isomerizing) [Candidatus Taylorbacteria bacterium CG11_big_fil_rev_8_21_14_0_20_46_11]|uniref:Glutamine--fructose-6-phosphate aminotransferase [isomerizing] n=1 Tax=Candidatus Taylorbacteria bacterium CG11_big_fil_rev_8_21_14_0_20_46_11 TaxID=1975025 RepID=A0A2H0KD48_9BACT|nr:MAG: glutamine--fructose-6-phosphate transaminase (isomerizing) [Candidatus Taylorbacteria bacterium CG11_big_fil_rev_8_21_14_0_20_46_11]